jgi:hypothetical protein
MSSLHSCKGAHCRMHGRGYGSAFYFSTLDPDPHVKRWIWTRIKVKIEPWRAVDPQNGGLKAQNEAYRPVVADSRHFEKEYDLDPHIVKSSIWLRISVKSSIRIRIKVMRIRNPGRR